MINEVQKNMREKEMYVISPLSQRYDNINMKSLLTREEAMLFLRNSKSIGEAIDRISNIYSNTASNGLVITFSFVSHEIGFTHVMVREGFLQLTYDGVNSEGVPLYNESEISFVQNNDVSFRASDYWYLKKLADKKRGFGDM